MGLIAYYAGFSFPIALLAFIGAYFGIWKKTESRLPTSEVLSIFFGIWALCAVLVLAFQLVLGTQHASAADLWGPLVFALIVGRFLVNRRRGTTRPAAAEEANHG